MLVMLSGIVIDSLVYAAMGNWLWTSEGVASSASPGDYERVLADYLKQQLLSSFPIKLYAPGSNQTVDTDSSIECLIKVINYIVG